MTSCIIYVTFACDRQTNSQTHRDKETYKHTHRQTHITSLISRIESLGQELQDCFVGND